MSKNLKSTLFALLMAAASIAATPAQAQVTAYINGVGCLDGAACDSNPNANQVTWITTLVPGFSIVLNASLANLPGGPAFSILDMTFQVNAIGSSGGAITLGSSANGFTFPASGVATHLISDLAGNFGGTGGTATGQSFVTLPGPIVLTTGPQGLQTVLTLDLTSATPFDLSQLLTINLNGNGLVTGDFKTEIIPEPAPLALLAIGLVGLALARRRKQS